MAPSPQVGPFTAATAVDLIGIQFRMQCLCIHNRNAFQSETTDGVDWPSTTTICLAKCVWLVSPCLPSRLKWFLRMVGKLRLQCRRRNEYVWYNSYAFTLFLTWQLSTTNYDEKNVGEGSRCIRFVTVSGPLNDPNVSQSLEIAHINR